MRAGAARWVYRKMDLVKCRIIGHRDGYGCLAYRGRGRLLSIGRQMYRVFDGDEVVAQSGHDIEDAQKDGCRDHSRAHTSIVRRYMQEGGIGYLMPHNRRISNRMLIHESKVVRSPVSWSL